MIYIYIFFFQKRGFGLSFELRLGYVLSLAELLQTLLIREALTSEQHFKFIDVILLTDLDTWAIIPLEN